MQHLAETNFPFVEITVLDLASETGLAEKPCDVECVPSTILKWPKITKIRRQEHLYQ